MSKKASSITSTNSDSNALNGFKKRQCHLICKWLPFSSFHHQFLESCHKYLRFCDLCKELAFGSPDALRQNQDFIQLVRAQNVLPPVPGERLLQKGFIARARPCAPYAEREDRAERDDREAGHVLIRSSKYYIELWNALYSLRQKSSTRTSRSTSTNGQPVSQRALAN